MNNEFELHTVTHEWIHAYGTRGIGWTKKQTDLLGVPRPLRKGWVFEIVGTKIPVATAREFERLHQQRQIKIEAKVKNEKRPIGIGMKPFFDQRPS